MIKIHKVLSIALVISVIFSGVLALKNANDFKSSLFKFNSIPSGVYEIEIGDYFTNRILMAYGDYNGDKYTDMITVTSLQNPGSSQTISVNLWSTQDGRFVEYDLPVPKCKGAIKNIIPGDINFDGQLDMVVVTAQGNGQFCLDFFKQNNCMMSGCPFESLDFSATFNPIQMKSQPIAGDFTGQHFFQLMIYNSLTQKREIFEFQPDRIVNVHFLDLYSKDDNCQDYPNQFDFSVPHFSSVVDFNGDCRADLVIQTQQGIEFWAKDDNKNFCLVAIQQMKRAGASIVSFTFADVNFDGSIDMVALVQDNGYRIVTMYNKFRVSASNLCSKFKQYPYELISSPSSYVQYQDETIDVYSNNQGYLPVQIRMGDINWDGQPDIIITTNTAGANYGQPIILTNSDCNDSDCANLSVSNKRQFLPSTSSNFNSLYKTQAINIAFFDINEDGKLDFMVNTFENGMYSIRCFFNYIQNDAFFLKALGLNGQCTTSSCQSSVYYGASYQCKVTTLDTQYKTATGAQLTQSANGALQLPFVILGLSRTNNYIENFSVGLSQPDADTSTRSWTPIIPNSQLIIFPYTLDPSKWEISIFVQPNDALIIVIIVTVIILAILGSIIIYYRRQEINQDTQNQEEFLKMIR
ncbi:integrin alpha FG-GAP repeat protein (macronuclear) [Tetrahymena thermophila SB210]|uniref:Integrin alpha FG-GAP repeat protein n=1 Tax=Tetrahymena thermophila (strain SB210) TaxID=312017 RepID=Q23AR5_TETTS|nr:integrin alpha FG-GAP repeat protein [Tetrahymena thermophila SB210]EAR93627.2 integrin alpha FG-GAP repeat protein [Tetrahymena thermophila SB210]|eukprot:XP_001013872.2 integrin alpha FG-GAP repeat protein [Tetrahymena thermophila SB210]